MFTIPCQVSKREYSGDIIFYIHLHGMGNGGKRDMDYGGWLGRVGKIISILIYAMQRIRYSQPSYVIIASYDVDNLGAT